MKRRRNVLVWAGFLIVLAGGLSYLPLFVRFPITRDLPWANLLLFAAGGALIALGLKRAFRQPDLYRGKISGAVLATLSVILLSLFLFGIFYGTRQLPRAEGAPQVGQKAPDFTLPDQHGNLVTLSSLLASPAGNADKNRAVLLIFYRGYW